MKITALFINSSLPNCFDIRIHRIYRVQLVFLISYTNSGCCFLYISLSDVLLTNIKTNRLQYFCSPVLYSFAWFWCKIDVLTTHLVPLTKTILIVKKLKNLIKEVTKHNLENANPTGSWLYIFFQVFCSLPKVCFILIKEIFRTMIDVAWLVISGEANCFDS